MQERAGVLAAVAVLMLSLGVAAAAGRENSANAKLMISPTPGAEAYFKTIALKRANLVGDTWIQSHFSHPGTRLSRCRNDHAQGVPDYHCNVVVGSKTLGFAYLERHGTCVYQSLIGTTDGKHEVAHVFQHCG